MTNQRIILLDLAVNFELWPPIHRKKCKNRQNNVTYKRFGAPDVV